MGNGQKPQMRSFGLFIILTLVLNHMSVGQIFPEKDLIGTWKVDKVENQLSESEMTPDQKENMGKIIKAFVESRFIFKADQKFVFEFSFTEMAISDGHWKYDGTSGSLTIKDWKERDKKGSLLMELRVVTQGEKVLFRIEDSPFVLEVRKI